jgi:bifunctional non-homologous end joining protein LigD
MSPATLHRSRALSAAALQGAISAPFPGFIAPCDPTLRDRAPSGDDWLYEIKADGYRAQLHVRPGRVTVYSRRGFDWSSEFAVIASAAKSLQGIEAVIDGEAVVYGETGRPDFQALRRELARPTGRLRYHAFDLLYANGSDIRNVSYVDRKALLKQLLADAPEVFIFVEYLEGEGELIFTHACKVSLEGIIAKRRNAPYRSGRVESWLKLKCVNSSTFPIVAFVEKLGANPRRIASLYVGRREGDRLIYAGKVRTGYTDAVARAVREILDPHIIKRSPLTIPVRKPKATWVQPVVDAEVTYSDVTDDGLLRAAVFKGLRDDLAAVSSGREE